MNDSLTQIQSICQHGIALAEKATPGPWQFGEACGQFSLYCPRHGLLLVMDATRKGMNGAEMRVAIREGTKGGIMQRVSELPGASAHPDLSFIAHSRTLLPALATALQEATDYINGFTTCDGEDCDCRHHTAAKSVLARIAASLTAAQTP